MSTRQPISAHWSFPAPPEGWQNLAWFGLALTVPDSWNVTFQRGENKSGALGLADLHAMRLEIRWRRFSLRQATRYRERLFQRLKKKNTSVLQISHDLPAFRIQTETGVLVLIQASRRLYELSWPSQPAAVEAVVASFRDYSSEPRWPWAMYGAGGWVPASYSLRRVDLLPGAVKLQFRRFRQHITLGAFSMADRLLAGRSLRDFAAEQIPLVRAHPGGSWESHGSAEAFTFTARAFWPPFRSRQSLFLRHLPSPNIIQYIQRTGPLHGSVFNFDPLMN